MMAGEAAAPERRLGRPAGPRLARLCRSGPAGDWGITRVLRTIALFIVAAALFLAANGAQAQTGPRRMALVIGNANYIQTGQTLDNAENDATDIGDALQAMQFQVSRIPNGTQADMRVNIGKFIGSLRDGDFVVIYYAGHGVEVGGVTYMIPVDARMQTPGSEKLEGIPLDLLYPSPKLAGLVIIFDACRDNPFIKRVRGSVVGAMNSPPANTLIVFSSSSGQVAADSGGGNRNGAFAAALLQGLKSQPTVDSALRQTIKQVREQTNGDQVPTRIGGLDDEFYLRGGASPPPRLALAPPPAASPAVPPVSSPPANPQPVSPQPAAPPPSAPAGGATATPAGTSESQTERSYAAPTGTPPAPAAPPTFQRPLNAAGTSDDAAPMVSQQDDTLPEPNLTRPQFTPLPDVARVIPAKFCSQVDMNDFLNTIYTPATQIARRNYDTALAHQSYLHDLYKTYLDRESGPKWGRVRVESEAFDVITANFEKLTYQTNDLYSRIRAVPIVTCGEAEPTPSWRTAAPPTLPMRFDPPPPPPAAALPAPASPALAQAAPAPTAPASSQVAAPPATPPPVVLAAATPKPAPPADVSSASSSQAPTSTAPTEPAKPLSKPAVDPGVTPPPPPPPSYAAAPASPKPASPAPEKPSIVTADSRPASPPPALTVPAQSAPPPSPLAPAVKPASPPPAAAPPTIQASTPPQKPPAAPADAPAPVKLAAASPPPATPVRNPSVTPPPPPPPKAQPAAPAPSSKAPTAADIARAKTLADTGQAAVLRGQYDQARDAFLQAFALNPAGAEALNGRGFVYYLDGDLSTAQTLISQAIDLKSPFPEAHYNLGMVYLAQGVYTGAIQQFDKAIAENDKYAQAYNGRGKAWLAKLDYTRAMADFSMAIQLNPRYADAFGNRGRIYFANRDYEKAMADFKRAIEQNPQFPDAFYGLGRAEYETGDYDLAISTFEELVSLRDDYAAECGRGLAYLARAKTSQSPDDFRMASTSFKKALEFKPQDPDAHNRLTDVSTRTAPGLGFVFKKIDQSQKPKAGDPGSRTATLDVEVACRT